MDIESDENRRQVRGPSSTHKGARSRQRILDAAARILGSDGAAGLTIASIAGSAGISKGSVYYYFEDVDQIVHEVVLAELDRLVSTFEAAAAAACSAHDAIRAIAEAFVGMIRRNAALVRYLLGQIHFAAGGATVQARVRQRVLGLISSQLQRGKAEGTVRPDVNCDVAAAAILGAFLAVAAYGLGDRCEPLDEEQMGRDVLSFVAHGVLRQGDGLSGA